MGGVDPLPKESQTCWTTPHHYVLPSVPRASAVPRIREADRQAQWYFTSQSPTDHGADQSTGYTRFALYSPMKWLYVLMANDP